MTYSHLKSTLLEGAPTEEDAKLAEESMKHHSYTSLSFKVTSMLKESRLTPEQQDDLVVSFSLNFYLHDLERYKRIGTFDKK
jgi:hypothetical protein